MDLFLRLNRTTIFSPKPEPNIVPEIQQITTPKKVPEITYNYDEELSATENLVEEVLQTDKMTVSKLRGMIKDLL